MHRPSKTLLIFEMVLFFLGLSCSQRYERQQEAEKYKKTAEAKQEIMTRDQKFEKDQESKGPVKYTGIAQEATTDATQSIKQKRAGKYNGEALNSQFVAQGVGKRKCIPLTRAQVSRLLRSPGGAQLSITTKHRWKATVTIEEFDASGTKAYSIEGMVAEQGGEGVTRALLPMGPGTIYRMIGDVKLLGHTIKADKFAPLIFVVHNVSNSKEADANFATEGPLAPIKFAFDDKINPKPEEQKDVPRAEMVYLQLVHLEGKGSALLESGETVLFR